MSNFLKHPVFNDRLNVVALNFEFMYQLKHFKYLKSLKLILLSVCF